MGKHFLCAAIILGLIGYVLSNCEITPCLYGGKCLPNVRVGINEPPFICACHVGFSGILCEMPYIRQGFCPYANAADMLKELVNEHGECQADCAFDSDCQEGQKCCLHGTCNMKCIPAANTELTPCQQERLMMNITKRTFLSFGEIRNINFQEYVTAVQGRSSFNDILGSTLESVSLTQALEMFGNASLGTIFKAVINSVAFPDPMCSSSGTYEWSQCSSYLSDGRQGKCMPLNRKFQCLKLPVEGDGSKYRDVETGDIIDCMGTFDEGSCACIAYDTDTEAPCVSDVDLPFETEYGTRERRWWAWIQNYGVLLKPLASATGGMYAHFDGRGSLRIPLFSNSGWGRCVYIVIRYKEDVAAVGDLDPMALFTNAACEWGPLHSPSIAITHNPPSELGIQLEAGAKTTFNVTTTPGVWKTVTLRFNSAQPLIELTLNGAPVPLLPPPFPGTIKKMTCPAGVGVGNGFANFKGCIDYVRIYRCCYPR